MERNQSLRICFVLCLAVLCFTEILNADDLPKVYWADAVNSASLSRIDLTSSETQDIRLKAEVPEGKTLKAYSFTLNYDPSVISVISVERPEGSAFPPLNINDSTPGTIILNAFNTKGVTGRTVISLIDVTIKGTSPGSSSFSIHVKTFGSSTYDQFKPEPDNLLIYVKSDGASVLPGDVDNNGTVDMKDEILSAQILAGIPAEYDLYKDADVNGDERIGIEEMIYILRKIAGLIHVPGDINGDSMVNISDAVLALQILCGRPMEQEVYTEADVNKDGRIGIEESIYILRKISEY